MSFFTPFLKFLIYLIHNILLPLSNIYLFIVDHAANIPCNSDSDCTWKIYYTYKCKDGFCVYIPIAYPQEDMWSDLIFPR